MKTCLIDDTHVQFSTLGDGDVFLYDGHLFLKIEGKSEAVYLRSGQRHTFGGSVRVHLVDGEFVWRKGSGT